MFKLELLARNLEACQRDISHGDVKVRLAVVRDLARAAENGDRGERVQLLLFALGDANAEVRRQGLVALADMQAKEARDRALSLLRDVQIEVRQMAVLCLGEIADQGDEEVSGRLASLLRAGDPSVRYQALIAHCQLCPEDALGDLIHALQDEDGEIRELSVRLVDEVLVARDSSIGGTLREALLRAAADDGEPRVRLVAQLLCAELGFEAPREMIHQVIDRRFRVRELRDEQRAVALAGRLRLTDSTQGLSRRAYGRFGFSADPFRWSALASLCQLGDERALEKLKAALRARSSVDRNMAVQSLGESGRPEALSLLKSLRDHPGTLDPDVLTQAILSLETAPSGGNLRD